jgi:hypothetical protein
MASINTTTNILKEAITLLCATHKHPLLIGGSKVNIKLRALPMDKNLWKHIFSCILEANNIDLPNKDHCMIFQHISTHQEILDDPSIATYLAQNVLQFCKGIFVNLQFGRSAHLLTCIFTRNRTILYLKEDDLKATISVALKAKLPSTTRNSTLNPMTPQQCRGRGRSKASFNPSQFTKNLPIQTSLQASKHMKYHVIINIMGGIATANIYFAHFDDNNIRVLTNGIAHSLHKSYNTFFRRTCSFPGQLPTLHHQTTHRLHECKCTFGIK